MQGYGRRIGTKEEEAFFIGDGKGKPTGIFNATGGAETGVKSTGTSITFDDVMDLYYSFVPILLPNSLEMYCSILNTLSFKSSSDTLIMVASLKALMVVCPKLSSDSGN